MTSMKLKLKIINIKKENQQMSFHFLDSNQHLKTAGGKLFQTKASLI